MKELIAITRFLGFDDNGNLIFHFVGVYKGEYVKKIIVNIYNEPDFMKGEDYILFLQAINIDKNCLFTKLIKYKEVNKLFWV